MKAMDNSVWRGRWGGYGLTAVIAGALAWLIWHYGDEIGLQTTEAKSLALVVTIMIVMVFRHGRTIGLAIQQYWHRFHAKGKNELPGDESRLAQAPARNITVTEIRHALHHLYGRRWSRKVRILLVTGTVAEVEQLTPGLTTQYWQEDRGTLLLWGGDLNSPPDGQWLTALRKLRQRPADGIVWVTSAFDRLPASELVPLSEAPPSDSQMDTYALAIRARNEALGWVLPLYVWSLHRRAGAVGSRITQATGCLFPAGCAPDTLSAQLAALAPQLISQGIQQISHDAQHHFLEAITSRAVSAFFAVSLAGLLLSIGAETSRAIYTSRYLKSKNPSLHDKLKRLGNLDLLYYLAEDIVKPFRNGL